MPLRLTYSATWIAAIRDCGPTCSSMAMPASMKMPSSTFSMASADRLQPKAAGAIGAGEYQRQPVGAVFEIVQRLRVGLRRIRMIDPLHDLPGRGRGAAGDRRGAMARADRSARSSGRHRSCRPASRTARPSARRRPACASRHSSPAQNRRPAAGRRLQIVIRPGALLERACCHWPENATRRPPSQTVVFGGGSGSSRGRAAARCPRSTAAASAAATLRPAIRRSGAISASGTSTKARSNSRGCGSVSSGLSMDDVVIGDQVEVEGARTPARFLGAVAAEFLLRSCAA